MGHKHSDKAFLIHRWYAFIQKIIRNPLQKILKLPYILSDLVMYNINIKIKYFHIFKIISSNNSVDKD